MKKITLLCLFTFTSYSFPLKEIVVNYDNGYSYKITYSGNFLTWLGLTGQDQGMSQTNKFGFYKLSEHIYLVRWIEQGNISVHSRIDLKKKSVVSSIYVPGMEEEKGYFYPFLSGSYKGD